MAIEDNHLYKFYKKNQKGIQVIEGILIVLMLVILNTLAYKNHQLNKEISETCGWEGEDYECFCEKDTALALKAELFGSNFSIVFDDTTQSLNSSNT